MLTFLPFNRWIPLKSFFFDTKDLKKRLVPSVKKGPEKELKSGAQTGASRLMSEAFRKGVYINHLRTGRWVYAAEPITLVQWKLVKDPMVPFSTELWLWELDS